ncbi:MAG: hypothetical protein JW889_14390 [Verrucomicrobia bacterium]|nr:hypothetical protein [Verrucomicrobiota bacterium]
MNIDQTGNGIIAAGAWYQLAVSADEASWIDVHIENGTLATLFVPSSVDTTDGGDLVGPVNAWKVDRRGESHTLSGEGASGLWKRKRYTIECADDWFAFGIEVEGQGAIETVRFFEGFLEGTLDAYILGPGDFLKQRPAYRQVREWLTGSEPGFDKVFVPDPVVSFHQWIEPFERGEASVLSSRDDLGGSWLFTPPPLCHCVRRGTQWVAIGVAAKPGENNFLTYEYAGGPQFGLRLHYTGATRVAGTWRSPQLVFVTGDNEYDAMARYVAWLRERGCVAVPERAVPDWWRRPIVCGWGEQCALTHRSGARPNIYASEPVYRRIVRVLREKQIPFGTLIIDDKWQAQYGLNRPDTGKWPDLRAFIDEMAAQDVHVLLWYNSWGGEGVPADECIRKDGKPLTVDPTNPAYERRLREQVRYMLSPEPGCLNASGFKIDFTADVPKDPDCEIHEPGVWGVELLKRLMSILYSAAKAARPDALVITHTANPYFAETTDMLRLNDICSDFRSVVPTMEHRQKVALAACPERLIDCDNYPLRYHPAWREYVAHQPSLGVPSLYYLTSLESDDTEFTDADYELLRRVFGEYVNGLG